MVKSVSVLCALRAVSLGVAEVVCDRLSYREGGILSTSLSLVFIRCVIKSMKSTLESDVKFHSHVVQYRSL